jgi:ubiquinone/menaquinone biosynthesis C-methylase UbiE
MRNCRGRPYFSRMSLTSWFFAAMYDRMLTKVEASGLADKRGKLLHDVTGDVLEVGAGTGANLRHYGDGIGSLTLTEPSRAMTKRLLRRVAAEQPDARVLRAPAEDLPFDDASFDVVVSTIVLCSVDDQPRAARELLRVLRPGGRLLFIEHVRSDDARLARWQGRMNWLNRIVADGCNCNRNTASTIESAGFSIDRLEHGELTGAPPFVRPLLIGTASAATR